MVVWPELPQGQAGPQVHTGPQRQMDWFVMLKLLSLLLIGSHYGDADPGFALHPGFTELRMKLLKPGLLLIGMGEGAGVPFPVQRTQECDRDGRAGAPDIV